MRTEYFYWLLATTPGQAQRIKGISRRALAYLLSRETSWKLSDDLASNIANATGQPPQTLNEPNTLPPEGLSIYNTSMTSADVTSSILHNSAPLPRLSRASSDFEAIQANLRSNVQNPHCVLSRTSSSSRSSSAIRTSDEIHDSSASHSRVSGSASKPTEPTLYWQSKQPRYSGIYTYISQPHRKPPASNYVKLRITYNQTPRNFRMILLFNDIRSLCAFRTVHQNFTRQRDSDEIWSPGNELVRSISAVCETVLSDMTEFLQFSSNEVARLVRYLHMGLGSVRISC